MTRTILTCFFALVSMVSMGQELTLKGVPVSELTSKYVEVYTFEPSMNLRYFTTVIDAGQIEGAIDAYPKKNSPHNSELLNSDGSVAFDHNPMAVLNYLDSVGGYDVVNMSVSVSQAGRNKSYLLKKRD